MKNIALFAAVFAASLALAQTRHGVNDWDKQPASW
jgi:hypothetical protein